MPTFANIDGEEPSTVTFRVGTVQIARGSTDEQQEILCLGDPDTSNAIAAITNAAPASTRWGLNVRIAGGPSSVADLAVRAVLPSTYGDHGLRILQSTGKDLRMSEDAGSAFTYGQSTFNSTAGQIVAASTGRKRLLIIQHGPAAAYLGASTVTSGTGLFLSSAAGNQIVMRHQAAVFAITAASTTTLSWIEETH